MRDKMRRCILIKSKYYCNLIKTNSTFVKIK